MTKLFTVWTLLLLAAPLAADSQARRIDFTAEGWQLSGAQTRIEALDGRTALRMRNGRAIFREVAFQDGTIEFDLKNAEARSFAYIQFRLVTDEEHEEIYFRPHHGNLPDAIQYSPVYRGDGQWQLYHGPGATAAAPLPGGAWTHVRLVVQGRRAAVFVGDVAQPQLVIPNLAREPRAGYLALRSFVPRDIAAEVDGGTFANLVVRPGVVGYDFAEVVPPPAAAGIVRTWQLSPAFVAPDGPVESLPAEILQAPTWQTVATLPSGLVELARHVAKPKDSRVGTVLARLRLHADRAATHRLDLGFSDQVSVFLDGRLLFSADHSYSFDAPRRQGLITFDQAAVYLALDEGEHELIVAVTDSFGGWGLMARIEDWAGLEIVP